VSGYPSRFLNLVAFVGAIFLGTLSLGACRMHDEAPPKREPAPVAAAAPKVPRKPRLVKPMSDEVLASVREAMSDASAKRRQVVVYVGATWCEPCQRFHQAVSDGRLDAAFPDVDFLEFDLDEARAGLLAAGYASQLIPLFAVPGDDGRSTGRHIQGGIKGDGAASELESRLHALLEKR
jgi:thiol:disulfide interchange protein